MGNVACFLGDENKPETLDESHVDTERTYETTQRQYLEHRIKLSEGPWSEHDILHHCALLKSYTVTYSTLLEKRDINLNFSF